MKTNKDGKVELSLEDYLDLYEFKKNITENKTYFYDIKYGKFNNYTDLRIISNDDAIKLLNEQFEKLKEELNNNNDNDNILKIKVLTDEYEKLKTENTELNENILEIQKEKTKLNEEIYEIGKMNIFQFLKYKRKLNEEYI